MCPFLCKIRKSLTVTDLGGEFGDPLSLLMNDPDHSIEEERYILLGMSLYNKLLVVTFAERSPFTRIISARRATRKEREEYEEND